jgi:plastocyanin
MNFPWRAAATATLLFVGACSGTSNDPAPATQTPASNQPVAPGSRSELVGKLAPAIAPPSALIVLEPANAVELPVKPEPAIMDQSGYEFLPGFLIAQAGQNVQFRNSEDILHNVRVSDASTQQPVFNVATVAFGKYEHKFDPGYYTVTCDIHPTMRASILVTRSPYTATTAADGAFSIANVRPGPYKLTIYAGAEPVVRSIEVKDGRTDLGVIQ